MAKRRSASMDLAKARERDAMRAMTPVERICLALDLGRRMELLRQLRPADA